MTTMGYVTRTENGAFKGPYKSITFRGDIEIVPVGEKPSEAHPDYRVYAQGVEVGAGWLNVGQVSQQEYVSLNLAHPEFGPRVIKLRLGRAAGQDDPNAFALIWNPEG